LEEEEMLKRIAATFREGKGRGGDYEGTLLSLSFSHQSLV